jgi:hypothetical protein
MSNFLGLVALVVVVVLFAGAGPKSRQQVSQKQVAALYRRSLNSARSWTAAWLSVASGCAVQ